MKDILDHRYPMRFFNRPNGTIRRTWEIFQRLKSATIQKTRKSFKILKSWKRAAQRAQSGGKLLQAAFLYQKAGVQGKAEQLFMGVARSLYQKRKYLRSAVLYQKLGKLRRAANLFGKSFESVLSILISFALFSSLSAYIILGPRVYYSMAKDRYFFRFAAEVHPKHGVPSKSIYLQGIIAVFMVTLGTFDQILTYMGFSLGLFPILAVFGVFKLRKRQKNGSLANSYRMPGFPFVPIFYMLTAAIILFLSFFERPVESSIAILMVIVGIPVFFLFAKKHNKKF